VTINAGTYSVDEGAHDGYTKSLSAECAGTIANGGSATCTITNDDQAATLTVIKHVINDNGGAKTAADFAITVSGGSPSPSTFAGSESGTSLTISAGGYSVAEGAHAGYTESQDAGCSGTIANGETKTCTVTNNDQTASLTVITVVIGGPNSASDFTMAMTGDNANPTPFPGVLTPGVLVSNLDAGIYAVNASVTPNGYALGSPCSGTLVNGGSATCTMTYTYTKSHTTLGTDMSWRLIDSATIGNFRVGAGETATNATMVFNLYGPSEAKDCGGTPIYTQTITGVTTAGPIATDGLVVTAPGRYRWVVSYSGDAYNDGSATTCGDETHTITVGEPTPQP
jgi:prealbumin domain-containing protein